jgi:acetyltransferase-like isoleucine patch superfamily enzyme
MRYLCVKRLAKSCGRKVLIFPGCSLFWLENCEIGENVTIHDFCYIDAVGGVKIGDNTRIAHNCSIISGQHKYDIPGKTIIDSGGTKDAVSIGCDVWLSTGAVITQGLSVGDGAVVGANSVVTKDVAPDSLVGGVPAKFIKGRFDTINDEAGKTEKA